MVVKTFKRWLLNKPKLDDSDMLWIKGNCYRVDCNIKSEDFKVSNGQNFRIVSKYEFIVTTDCVKQEAMLQLKYMDELLLLRVLHVEEGDHIMDEYGALY